MSFKGKTEKLISFFSLGFKIKSFSETIKKSEISPLEIILTKTGISWLFSTEISLEELWPGWTNPKVSALSF